MRGSKQSYLCDVKCHINCLNKEALSINNVYSLISISFEPNRRSHTGNVFQKCYYQDNNADIWYSLDTIRDCKESEYEEKLLLDYRIFTINSENIKENMLDEIEKEIVKKMKENNGLSGKQIKEFYKEKKQDFRYYIEIINDLTIKGFICSKDLE